MIEGSEIKAPPAPEQIRAARALLGLTAEELALEAGVGVSTVGRLERGFEVGSLQFDAIVRTLEGNGIIFMGPNLAIGKDVLVCGIGLKRVRRGRRRIMLRQ